MANRNRIEMSQNLFRLIFERGAILDKNFFSSSNRRWIKRHSAEDAKIMAEGDVVSLKLNSKTAGVIIEFNSKRYFGISGLSEPDILPRELEYKDLTPALFTCFILESRIDCSATAAMITEVAVALSDEVKGYDGHDLADIARLFPTIRFYEIDPNFIYTNKIERVIGAYLLRAYEDRPLKLTERSRECFISLFESGPESVPYEVALNGLLSFSWNSLYLDFYRCIEQLYSVPRIAMLTSKWTSSKSIYELAHILEDALSWRPKEEEAIIALFREIDNDVCHALYAEIKLVPLEDANNVSSSTAKLIYKLRNNCVHYRPRLSVDKMDKLTDTQWSNVIGYLAEIIGVLYTKFGSRFHQAANAVAITTRV